MPGLEHLIELRKQKGMTQEQLAAASGVHRITIAKYEAGMSAPGLRSIQRIARALGVTIDELIKDAGKPA